jgi:hypothetical protein
MQQAAANGGLFTNLRKGEYLCWIIFFILIKKILQILTKHDIIAHSQKNSHIPLLSANTLTI